MRALKPVLICNWICRKSLWLAVNRQEKVQFWRISLDGENLFYFFFSLQFNQYSACNCLLGLTYISYDSKTVIFCPVATVSSLVDHWFCNWQKQTKVCLSHATKLNEYVLIVFWTHFEWTKRRIDFLFSFFLSNRIRSIFASSRSMLRRFWWNSYRNRSRNRSYNWHE